MKTERIRAELCGATFVSIFFTETKTDTETPESEMKVDTLGNRYRSKETE